MAKELWVQNHSKLLHLQPVYQTLLCINPGNLLRPVLCIGGVGYRYFANLKNSRNLNKNCSINRRFFFFQIHLQHVSSPTPIRKSANLKAMPSFYNCSKEEPQSEIFIFTTLGCYEVSRYCVFPDKKVMSNVIISNTNLPTSGGKLPMQWKHQVMF